jgi:hypothetical protein
MACVFQFGVVSVPQRWLQSGRRALAASGNSATAAVTGFDGFDGNSAMAASVALGKGVAWLRPFLRFLP